MNRGEFQLIKLVFLKTKHYIIFKKNRLMKTSERTTPSKVSNLLAGNLPQKSVTQDLRP